MSGKRVISMFAYHQMASPMNTNHYHLQLRGLEVGEARNIFAEHALQNECKYIFFWDEDALDRASAASRPSGKARSSSRAVGSGGEVVAKQ